MKFDYKVGRKVNCIVEERHSFGYSVGVIGTSQKGLIHLYGLIKIHSEQVLDFELHLGQEVECIVLGYQGGTMYLSIRNDHLENPELVVEEEKERLLNRRKDSPS